MGMIEHVAIFMHQSADSRSKPIFRVEWKDCLPAYRQMLLSDARAAVEAIREPTEAMETAGQKALLTWPEVWPTDAEGNEYTAEYVQMNLVWRAMIDSILAEGQ